MAIKYIKFDGPNKGMVVEPTIVNGMVKYAIGTRTTDAIITMPVRRFNLQFAPFTPFGKVGVVLALMGLSLAENPENSGVFEDNLNCLKGGV